MFYVINISMTVFYMRYSTFKLVSKGLTHMNNCVIHVLTYIHILPIRASCVIHIDGEKDGEVKYNDFAYSKTKMTQTSLFSYSLNEIRVKNDFII